MMICPKGAEPTTLGIVAAEATVVAVMEVVTELDPELDNDNSRHFMGSSWNHHVTETKNRISNINTSPLCKHSDPCYFCLLLSILQSVLP